MGGHFYKPEMVCKIVRECAVLHNVAQLKDVALTPEDGPIPRHPVPVDVMHRF